MSRDFFLRKMEQDRIRVYQVRDGKNVLIENDDLLGMLAKWSDLLKERAPKHSAFCPHCHVNPCVC